MSATATAIRPRADSLPEHADYRDTGCDVYPSCLSCPLPRCRYDDPGGAAAQVRRGRDETIVLLATRDLVPIEKLATSFGVSRRTIFRVLAANKEAYV